MKIRNYIIISFVLVAIVLVLGMATFMKSKQPETVSETKAEENLDSRENISFAETLNMESLADESYPEEEGLHAASKETEEIIWSKDKIHFVNMDSFYDPESTLPLDAWSRISDETDAFLKTCNITAWELSGIPGSLKLIGRTYRLQVNASEIPDSVLTIFYNSESQKFDFRYEDPSHVFATENAP